MIDLEITETGNGGDLVKKPKDLSLIRGFQNMIYLAMFGGNVEASTPSERIETEQAFDWWGNSFEPNDPSVQMNSETERTLNKVALNSQGRVLIEQAVKKDLQFMKDFASVTVSVSISQTDRALIDIRVIKLDNLEERSFIYIWDATNNELTQKQ